MNTLKGEIGKMMFMSMVVHFAEFVMMSLVGIMSYRLYVSYMAWKNACAFSSTSASSEIATEKAISLSSEGSDSECQNVTKVNISLTRSTIKAPLSRIISDPLDVAEVKQSKNSDAKLIQAEKKSSTILNDYIGEFFSESQAVDIDAYRASTAVDSVRDIENSSAVKQNVNVANHDYIKVEPFSVVSESVKESSPIEESIPTLNEFCDVESDSFITVASINSEIKSSNKVMSDKVVMAMLDEAKLVRFS